MDYKGQRRCRNYSESHDKGHQFDYAAYSSRRLRRPENTDFSDTSSDDIEVGEYQSSYDPETYQRLWKQINKIHSQEHAMNMLAETASRNGINQLTGQRTCLTCLSHTPTNMLPCEQSQHGICEDCIRRYSSSKKHQSTISLDQCPLGCRFHKAPWTIRLKPKTAGPRILTLDGFVSHYASGQIICLQKLTISTVVEFVPSYSSNSLPRLNALSGFRYPSKSSLIWSLRQAQVCFGSVILIDRVTNMTNAAQTKAQF